MSLQNRIALVVVQGSIGLQLSELLLLSSVIIKLKSFLQLLLQLYSLEHTDWWLPDKVCNMLFCPRFAGYVTWFSMHFFRNKFCNYRGVSSLPLWRLRLKLKKRKKGVGFPFLFFFFPFTFLGWGGHCGVVWVCSSPPSLCMLL